MKTIIAMLLSMIVWAAAEGDPSKAAPTSEDVKNMDLSNLSKTEYLQFVTNMMELSKNKEELAKESKKMLTTMLGLEDKPEGLRMLDIDPIWNRGVLFAVVAVHNKIKLDDSDLDNWKSACVAVARKTEDKTLRLLIAGVYASVLSENEKLPKGKP